MIKLHKSKGSCFSQIYAEITIALPTLMFAWITVCAHVPKLSYTCSAAIVITFLTCLLKAILLLHATHLLFASFSKVLKTVQMTGSVQSQCSENRALFCSQGRGKKSKHSNYQMLAPLRHEFCYCV